MNQALDTNEDETKKGDQKKEGFKLALRRKVFQIYFELMRERNTDFIFAVVMMFTMFIQIYGFLYYSKIQFPFKDDLYETIYSLCDIIRIYPMIENSQEVEYYYAVAYVFIFIMVAYIMILFYIDYSIKIEKFYFVFPLKLTCYMSSIIFWILLIPIVEVFVSIFSCEDGYHLVDKEMECWGGIHFFFAILYSVSLILYCAIFFLISCFYNESRPYHTDSFARLDTNFETYTALYRIFIAIIGHFFTQKNLQWLIISIHVLGSAYFCKMYLKYLPYYNTRTSFLFGSGWFIYLWISINVLLTKALETLGYEGQSIVIIVGIVLIFPATKQMRESKILNKIYNKKHDKIKSEYELDIFIHKLYRLIIDQHVNEVDEMILLGVVHNHQSECLNSECPLNNEDQLYLPLTDCYSDRKSQYSKDPILLYHLINSIYAEYAKGSNSQAILHTTYAYFLFYQIGNVHTALLELNVAEKCDTNFQQKFTIYRAKRFIENYLQIRYGKKKESSNFENALADLEVTIVITFEGLFAKLNKEIEKSANDHIEFWSHLDSQMVDLNVLHKLGLMIINNTKRINEIWHSLQRINPNYPKALQIYGNYLVQIKNDDMEGDEFITQAKQLHRTRSLDEHINNFEMMFADDTAIVVISGNKDSQSKIMKTNNGITKLFGYNTFEVHGHEVNILMPPIIGVKHNYFIEQYFKTGKEQIINKDAESFAMLRVGHIFSVKLIIKPVPSLKNDIQYIGLIKPINKDYDFILCDQFGRIDSISKGITSMLQLQGNFFKENEIYIQVLCPQLVEVEKVRGTKEFMTKFDSWLGIKDLTYIIPKNFSTISQKTGARSGGNHGNQNFDNFAENDDDNAPNQALGHKKNEPSFIGLKSPDHLKKVCNMFKNNEFKENPQKYLQILKNNINYANPDIYKGQVKTEIIHQSHGQGHLHLKIFKILNPSKLGTGADSESEHGNVNYQGDKNARALLDETKKKLESISSKDLQKKISTIKISIESIKKGNRFFGKGRVLNITTTPQYEQAEIQQYIEELNQLQSYVAIIRKKEEEMKGTKFQEMEGEEENYKVEDEDGHRIQLGPVSLEKNFMNRDQNLLMEDIDIDVSELKGQYPLRDNAQGELSQNLTQKQGPTDVGGRNVRINENDNLIYEEEIPQEHKVKIKEEDDKMDLLKDLKKSKEKKKTVVKKEDGKEGEQVEEGKEGAGSTAEGQEEEEEEKGFIEEDNGSVVSSTNSLMKHLRMLRNALYENYAPPSILNLKRYGKILFMMLIVITIFWYIWSRGSYKQLQDNTQNIYSSKNRMNSLADIGADVRILTALQQNQVDKNRGGRDYLTFKRQNLNQSAQMVQEGQNNLSTSYLMKIFQDKNIEAIDPSSIELKYMNADDSVTTQVVDIWSAIMEVAVQAYTIKGMNDADINTSQTAVFFILENSFNSILAAITNSTDAILNETKNISHSVQYALEILLYVASGSLFVSICVIFPVATRVDQNKDELLKNFILIDREDVKKQLDKCRTFFNTMHDKEHVAQQNIGEMDEDDDELKEEEEAKEGEEDGSDQSKEKKGRKRPRKNKMHKKFSTNFISLIIKFVSVITILEGYFLLCYLLSAQFLGKANDIIVESGTITQRQFSNNFLYVAMQEVLTTNGTSFVMNERCLDYLFTYLNFTIQQQENFLQMQSSNQRYQSAQFNNFFNSLVYDNVCTALYDETSSEYTGCAKFMGGILQKGLYSANVAYWDNMRSIATDFNNSDRSRQTMYTTLNSEQLIANEELKDVYFKASYDELLSQLNLSILYNFQQQDNDDTILFTVYIVVLFLLYYVIWRKFIEQTRHSLWVTKSMLAIIPLEIIQKVPKIKDFLLASSKSTLSAFRE